MYYRTLTCNCTYYGVTLYSDSACSEVFPMAMPDTSVSPVCTASNEGSTTYPYERARIVTCNRTVSGYCPPPPPPPTGTPEPTMAPTLAPTTLAPTPAPEGKAVVVQATVTLSGISAAQFGQEARQAFKTVTALTFGSVCGADGASMCTAADVSITGVGSRRSSGISVQFATKVAAQNLQAAADTLSSAVSDGSFVTSLKQSNQNLAQVGGLQFAPGGEPAESTVSAPVVRTTMQCFNAKYAEVESGGLSPVQLTNFGWAQPDTLHGFVRTDSCSQGVCSSAMSSSSGKMTCNASPDDDAPLACVSYELVVQASNQSGSNLAYRMYAASCGTSQTCDSLQAAAEDTVLSMDEPDSMSIETIRSCSICSSDLCNTVVWPSVESSAEEESTVGITAYVGIGVGGIVCIAILFFLLRSVGQSCSQHGEPAYKQAAEE